MISEIQPMKVMPRKLAASGDVPNSEFNSSATAVDAKKVCAPYQKIATTPRTIAGKLAPMTPMLTRANTGYGMPCLTLGLPDKLTSNMMKKPARMIAAKTAQPFRP